MSSRATTTLRQAEYSQGTPIQQALPLNNRTVCPHKNLIFSLGTHPDEQVLNKQGFGVFLVNK